MSRVYVGNIPSEANERDLERFFRGYGRIDEVLLKRGYGFVEFDDQRDAEDAVYDLDGKKMLGARLTVEIAKGTPRGRDHWSANRGEKSSRGKGPPTRTNYRLIVENLSSSVSWQDLKDHMRRVGEVAYADAHKKYRNEGIIEFMSYRDMKRAIEKYDRTVLNGRKIRVYEDSETRRLRSRSRSHSRSHSRSYSRSYSKSYSRSKSRSRSASRNGKEKHSRTRSRSRSCDRDNHKSRSRSLSRSRSPSND